MVKLILLMIFCLKIKSKGKLVHLVLKMEKYLKNLDIYKTENKKFIKF